jgi:hypothetical protein
VVALVLLGGGAILLGNYLNATSGTPVAADVNSCQMHSEFTNTGAISTSGQRHIHRWWTCQASYGHDGIAHVGTLQNASHNLTGQRVHAYAKGSELLQTAMWHRNVGIAMLVAGVLFIGVVGYGYRRLRKHDPQSVGEEA